MSAVVNSENEKLLEMVFKSKTSLKTILNLCRQEKNKAKDSFSVKYLIRYQGETKDNDYEISHLITSKGEFVVIQAIDKYV